MLVSNVHVTISEHEETNETRERAGDACNVARRVMRVRESRANTQPPSSTTYPRPYKVCGEKPRVFYGIPFLSPLRYRCAL